MTLYTQAVPHNYFDVHEQISVMVHETKNKILVEYLYTQMFSVLDA